MRPKIETDFQPAVETSCRLLLIEDSPGEARLLEEMIHEGAPVASMFSLDVARTLAEGFQKLGAESFDLILLDLNLPDSTGLETFEAVIAHVPNVPIIILTSSGGEERALTAVRRGAQDFLFKGGVNGKWLAHAIRHTIERFKLTRELRQIKGQLEDVFNNTSDGLLVLDEEGVVRFANETASRMVGVAEENLKERPLPFSVTIGRDENQTVVTADNRVRSIRVSWTKTVWNHAPAQLCSLREFTDRVRAATFRQEYQFISRIFDILAALVVVLDRDGNTVLFNRTCQNLTGYSFDEIKERDFWKLLHPGENWRQAEAVFCEAKAGRIPVEFERPWVTKSGETRMIRWSHTVITGPDGTVEYVVATGTDETDARAREET